MRIILADDHKIVREGLRWMLSDEDDVEIVGEADSGEALLKLVDRVDVDIVLLDVRMPGMSGLDALEILNERVPDLKIIILSMHGEPAYVRRAVELGAAGYLLKSSDRDELLGALAAVAAGKAYIQGEVTETLMKTISGQEAGTSLLSPRETEILVLVSRGLENKQIATELGISEATVKTHLKGVFSRLDVSSRAEAAAVGLRLGLIE
ncbi:MAG: response regulator transcription factor [Acidimicrobiia bacterium]